MFFGGNNSGSAGPAGMHEGTARSGPGPNMAPVTLNVDTSANSELLNLSQSLRGTGSLMRYPATIRKNTMMQGDLAFRLVDDNDVPISGVFSDFSNMPIPWSVMTDHQLNHATAHVDTMEWLYKHVRFVGVVKEPIIHTDGGLSVGAINGLAPNTGVATVYANGTVKILADSRKRIRPSQWLVYVLPDAIEASRMTKYSRNVARVEPIPDDIFQRLVKHSRFSAFDVHYFRFLTAQNNSVGSINKNPFLMTSVYGKTRGVELDVIKTTDNARLKLAKTNSGFYEKSMSASFIKGFALIHALNAQGLLKLQTVQEKKRNAIVDHVLKGNSITTIQSQSLKNAIKSDDAKTFDFKKYTVNASVNDFEASNLNDAEFSVLLKKSKENARLSELLGLFKALKFKSNNPLSFVETARGMHAYVCMGNLHDDDLNHVFSFGAVSDGSFDHREDGVAISNEFLNALKSCDEEVVKEYRALSEKLQRQIIGHSLYASEGNPTGAPILDDNVDNPHVFMSITGASGP